MTMYSSQRYSQWGTAVTVTTAESRGLASTLQQVQAQAQVLEPSMLSQEGRIRKYTEYYHAYTVQAKQWEPLLKSPSETVRTQAEQHYRWAKYQADESSRAAHYFHQNPTATVTPFALPPAPTPELANEYIAQITQSSSHPVKPFSSSSASSLSPPQSQPQAQPQRNTQPHQQQQQQPHQQHQQQLHQQRHHQPQQQRAYEDEDEDAPATLTLFVDRSLSLCRTQKEKEQVMEQVQKLIQEAILAGDLHTKDWNQVSVTIPKSEPEVNQTSTKRRTFNPVTGTWTEIDERELTNKFYGRNVPASDGNQVSATTPKAELDSNQSSIKYRTFNPVTGTWTEIDQQELTNKFYGRSVPKEEPKQESPWKEEPKQESPWKKEPKQESPWKEESPWSSRSDCSEEKQVEAISAGSRKYYKRSSSDTGMNYNNTHVSKHTHHHSFQQQKKHEHNHPHKHQHKHNHQHSHRKKTAGGNASENYYGPASNEVFSDELDFISLPNVQSGKRKSSSYSQDCAVMDNRAKRFSGPGGIADTSSVQNIATSYDQYMGKGMIGGKVMELSEEDYEQMTVKGTSQTLEKEYLRLTSPPRPELVRPQAILEQHLENLKAERLRTNRRDYAWFCSQLKAIRQDCTVQRIQNEFTVKVYEYHARLALEDEDLNEYNQCQTQLKELYQLLSKDSDATKNRFEFLAYRLIYYVYLTGNQKYNGGSLDVLRMMLALTPTEREAPAVRHALQVREAVADSDYHAFFRLREASPNLGAYLMDYIVPTMRHKALLRICKAYRPTVEVNFVMQELGFEKQVNGDFFRKWLLSCGCVLSEDGCEILATDSVVRESDMEVKRSLI